MDEKQAVVSDVVMLRGFDSAQGVFRGVISFAIYMS